MRHMLWVSTALLSMIVGTAFWPDSHVGAMRERAIPTALGVASPPSSGRLSNPVPVTTVEVNSAVERVFGKDVVTFNPSQPVYVSKDLNGDGADDLAVMVTVPGKSVSAVNSEL